ncbi:MAG: ABC transporter substrate-binding protein [Acidimicrobiaceae bacterium]|nr:ABC transporter substrate-binding protein [Acidimicrobiaceae bacterium]MCY4176506.1 ABC transporter substrate-binding protein [Acidimicrobiaceae bacterium]MCY4280476.1 ABC transporter substrate-binding protein [Acidimicrobiaceae bacterium]MCY4294841.1 ABC transporter substrate-binding protein [Acidimicrobiaceae bacterium]
MSNKTKLAVRLMAALFALTMVASACGDDDVDDSSVEAVNILADDLAAAQEQADEAAAAVAEAEREAAAAQAALEEAMAAADDGSMDADAIAELEEQLAAAQAAEAAAAAAAEEAAAAAAAAAADAAAAAMAPVSITIAAANQPTKLDPHFQDGAMRRTMENVYERLVERDLVNPAIFVPRLAASLPLRLDDTTWELKLRRGITFHSGEPFNAASVKHSFERILFDQELNSDLLEQVETITGVEIVDDYTVQILTAGPDPVLPARLYMVQMVPAGATNDGLADDADGTGPYRFVEWSAGDSLTLTRNLDYWGAPPQIDEVKFVFLPDEQARVSALQAGEVHLAVGLSSDSVGDVPKLFVRDEGIEYPYLRMKNYEGPLADYPDLKVAIAHALNVDDYIQFIYEGQASRPNCHIFGSGVFGHNPEISDRPYDPELAQQIVADSGYQGEAITFWANGTRWTKFDELSEAIAADMMNAGLNIDFELMPWEVWLNQEFLTYPAPVGDQSGPTRGDIFLSSSSNELQDGSRLGSYIGNTILSSYLDDTLEGMLADAAGELDPRDREEMYHEIMEYTCENVALLPVLTYLSVNGGVDELSWIPRYDDTARVEDMTLS